MERITKNIVAVTLDNLFFTMMDLEIVWGTVSEPTIFYILNNLARVSPDLFPHPILLITKHENIEF